MFFPNQGQFVFSGFFLFSLGFVWVTNTSAGDCLERLISKMTLYVSNGMFNSTHSFICSFTY